jgi:UDP-glucose 4-epimerase
MVLDDLSTGKKENVPQGSRFVLCDIASETAAEAVRSFRPDVVDHHAAQISVRRSVSDPVHDASVNILGTLRLLSACRDAGVGKFIFASSGGAGYGDHEVFAAAEDHPLRPMSPYGAAKMSVELYLSFYRSQYGLDYTALRYSNVYGPGQDPHGEAGVVAIFAERLLRGQAAIINGDGEQSRDFVFVEDSARANVAALSRGGGKSINIGTGVETSINTLFRMMRALAGSDQDEIHGPAMPGEQRRSVLENVLALEELGWNPETQLPEGLPATMAFFREKIAAGDRW